MTEFAVSDVQEWESVASETFVPLQCTDSGSGFSAALKRTELLPGMSIVKIHSDSVRVERSDSLVRQTDHNDLLLSLQLRANGRVYQHGRTADLRPGSAALYETNHPYILEHPQNGQELLVFQFQREGLNLTNEVITELCGRTIDRTVPGMSAFTGYLQGMMQEQTPRSFSAISELGHFSQEILSIVLRSFAKLQPTLSDFDKRLTASITSYIKNNFPDSALSVESIAAAHHISQRKLYELFAQIDETLGRYLQRTRLNHAKRLLGEHSINNLTIESIALNSGFASAASFTRRFKQTHGLPPSKWQP